jgi:hypothetical protein
MIILIIIEIILLIIFVVAVFSSLKNRKVGDMIITQDENGVKTFSLELDKPPGEFEDMNYILFKVINKINSQD